MPHGNRPRDLRLVCHENGPAVNFDISDHVRVSQNRSLFAIALDEVRVQILGERPIENGGGSALMVQKVPIQSIALDDPSTALRKLHNIPDNTLWAWTVAHCVFIVLRAPECHSRDRNRNK